MSKVTLIYFANSKDAIYDLSHRKQEQQAMQAVLNQISINVTHESTKRVNLKIQGVFSI